MTHERSPTPARAGHAALASEAGRRRETALIIEATSTGPVREKAFAKLWQQHEAYVRAFCIRRLGDRAEAEDVAQNVAVKAYGVLRQFAHRCRFRTWLTSIAISQCADHRRRETRQKDIARRLFAMHSGLPEYDTTSEQIDPAPIKRSVRALRLLPAPAREVLMMRFYRDLSIEDIGCELDLGLSGTKMRLYRSIEHLRASYYELDALDACESRTTARAAGAMTRVSSSSV